MIFTRILKVLSKAKAYKTLYKKLASLKCNLSPVEIMTIVIFYHFSGYKCFKYYYQKCILSESKSYFPDAVFHNRFSEIKKTVNLPLYMFIYAHCRGKLTGT